MMLPIPTARSDFFRAALFFVRFCGEVLLFASFFVRTVREWVYFARFMLPFLQLLRDFPARGISHDLPLFEKITLHKSFPMRQGRKNAWGIFL